MADTLVTFLLDKSGSMGPIRADTIGAFNAYLDELKTDSEGIVFSFLQFDTNSTDVLCRNMPVKDVKALTEDTYRPNGGTPLIDAAYKTIKAVEKAVAERSEAPKVVICFQTDGQEKSSTQHSWNDLQTLIKEKTALGWQFNFMGCGIDAYAQGGRMGIAAVNSMSYDRHSAQATKAAFSASAENTKAFASGLVGSTAYSGAQRVEAKDKYAPVDLLTRPAEAKPEPKSLADDITL